MFTKSNMINTQIKKNKRNKRLLMKTLGIFEMQALSDKFYSNFGKGKTIAQFFQENAIAKKHVADFEILLLNKFLRSAESNVTDFSKHNLQETDRFVKLAKMDKELDLGYIYCFNINNRIKIGRTRAISKRIENYKSHNGISPVILKLVILPQHCSFETTLKNELNISNKANEWFEEEQLKEILEKIT